MICPAHVAPTLTPAPRLPAVAPILPWHLLVARCAPLRACRDLSPMSHAPRARCAVWSFFAASVGSVDGTAVLRASADELCRPGVVRCRCTDGACIACDDHGWLWPVDGVVPS